MVGIGGLAETATPANYMDDFQVLVKIAGGSCNLRCRYCYYLPRAKAGETGLPEDLLELYIRQHIAASRDPVIAFSWHGGEPTLYGLDRFRHIVSLQEKLCPPGRSIVNGIQTNGLLLDEDWCRFLAEEKGARFVVGLSLDGPEPLHDRNRVGVDGKPTFRRVMESFARLRRYGVPVECLCVVCADNVRKPREVYEFFRSIAISHLTFLPLVEILLDGRVGERTVPAGQWGEFLCTIFDLWQERDIGRIQIQLFEETMRTAFGQEHSLCVLRETCGGVPILDCDGNVYSCDHFADSQHLLGNIRDTTLAEMLVSPSQRSFGEAKHRTLPAECRRCPVLGMCGGGCPKDRIAISADGESGLNFLCAGFKRFFLHAQPFVNMLAALAPPSTR
ncbi:MAG: anaerobic sulfatase maturase [Acidobacteriota bacterium]|jgi:uncharacterized protein|nr:anaerobic sulfatase maturase [Acidobacteriota bacterium]